MESQRFPRFIVFLLLIAVLSSLAAYEMVMGVGDEPESGLLGLSTTEVISHLGVPDGLGISKLELFFLYNGERTVRFHDNCSYWVNPEFKGISNPKAIPTTGAYPGQTMRELAARMGQPERVAPTPLALNIVYGDQSVTVAHGIVLGVRDH